MHRNHGYVGDETQGFLLATVVQGSDNIIQWIGHYSEYREDICLQTSFLLFKFANHRNKRPFVLTANKVLVGTLMTIGDVNNIFAINISHVKLWPRFSYTFYLVLKCAYSRFREQILKSLHKLNWARLFESRLT